ncbi:macrolide ABC transporter ATP-binding protein [Candidatus Campbellbacteria bacterium RIFOXYC2_FULL_35_25]|uniref:Macrolide ABC transporter ATP-binding protein n=1 Tax=Candidatus Campbellbacteria bacterium RIFOXYC2_FULL_35_25 TaxID=1797582 RepID=A0A1F5EK34_9BACT|nr:MAG: macrolide ABC transporter ATP-binding protein [Candidatus Campbellbacteria bacterium RIFOXYC2_FULL_35_25]
MQPLISVKDLEKTFYDSEIPTQALRGVTFDIQKGEFVAIMGASGSGKSTLLHMIGFLDQYTKGEYFFDGENIANFDDDEIAHIRNKKIGFVFQSFNLLSGTSVLENVKLPLVYSDVPEKQWNDLATKAIEAVGLSHRIGNDAQRLSVGEKQRVSIARALVNDPDVIFADEPTGNLDSKSGGQVMDIIKRLSHKGKTVVLITHETHTAEYAQRIIRILDGKIFSDEKVAHVREEGEFIK